MPSSERTVNPDAKEVWTITTSDRRDRPESVEAREMPRGRTWDARLTASCSPA